MPRKLSVRSIRLAAPLLFLPIVVAFALVVRHTDAEEVRSPTFANLHNQTGPDTVTSQGIGRATLVHGNVTVRAELRSKATGLARAVPVMIRSQPVEKLVTSATSEGAQLLQGQEVIVQAGGSCFYPWNCKGGEQWDQSGAVQGSILMWFLLESENDRDYVRARWYDGKWRTLDSGLSFPTARMLAGCNGPQLGGGWCDANDEWTIYSPSVASYPSWGSTYVHSPYWHEEYVAYNSAFGLGQCGRSFIDIQDGGEEWELTLLVCVGSLGFPWP